MRFTADDIISIHDKLITKSGGTLGVLSTSTLTYIVFECNKRQDVFLCSAVALHGIVTRHPFFDGNKRTGLTMAYMILYDAGYELQLEDEEAMHFLLKVAKSKISVKEVEAWLRQHSMH